jgi:hypothetical protein
MITITSGDDFESILEKIEAGERARAEKMPDERAAILQMFEAVQRLKELGWNDAIYCPKDGSEFDAIEAGSTGIHRCHYEGKWPDGHWWVADNGDLWPSRPILFRKTPNAKLSRAGTRPDETAET